MEDHAKRARQSTVSTGGRLQFIGNDPPTYRNSGREIRITPRRREKPTVLTPYRGSRTLPDPRLGVYLGTMAPFGGFPLAGFRSTETHRSSEYHATYT